MICLKYAKLQIKEPFTKLSVKLTSHQNATRRGRQTVKIVFDITCGTGDFRVHAFCPMETINLP